MLCLALNKFGDREHFQNLAKLYDVINLLTLSLYNMKGFKMKKCVNETKSFNE